ncbi:hypothetical protein HK101_008501 [Irineochytrium annulatum]|nr:hypothetical protein HK101_008501 [Irineochytrium annulatum]
MQNFDWLLPDPAANHELDWLTSDIIFHFDEPTPDFGTISTTGFHNVPMAGLTRVNAFNSTGTSPDAAFLPSPATTTISHDAPFSDAPSPPGAYVSIPSSLPPSLATDEGSPPPPQPVRFQSVPPPEDKNDKRRRNTAASARFRAKKKMREAELERGVTELRARSEVLERRVLEQDLEIRWLRAMVAQSRGKRTRDEDGVGARNVGARNALSLHQPSRSFSIV